MADSLSNPNIEPVDCLYVASNGTINIFGETGIELQILPQWSK